MPAASQAAVTVDEDDEEPELSSLTKNDGEITFGALDTTKFDPATLVTFDNVATSSATAGFWEGAMDAITADGQDIGLSPLSVGTLFPMLSRSTSG